MESQHTASSSLRYTQGDSPTKPTEQTSMTFSASTPRLPHRHFHDSSSDEETGGTLLEKMERHQRQRSKQLKQPMSSPVRQVQRISPLHSKALGEKYTLRTRNYVPFRKEREIRRDREQLERRGGSEEMARFVMEQDEREERERLKREAELVAQSLKVEELNISEEEEEEEEEEEDRYQKELEEMEEMLRLEQENIEAMIADLSLS